jgi:hypothetical protein
MTVILNVILNLTFDTTTVIPINCQVGITSYVCSHRIQTLTNHWHEFRPLLHLNS